MVGKCGLEVDEREGIGHRLADFRGTPGKNRKPREDSNSAHERAPAPHARREWWRTPPAKEDLYNCLP